MSTKRILILLLSVLMLLCLALSACGGEEEESSSKAPVSESSEASSKAESSKEESMEESSEEASSEIFISDIELPSEPESSEEASSEEESSEAESSEEESVEESSEESSEAESSEEESMEESSEESIPDTDPYRDGEGNYTLNDLEMPAFEFPDTLFTVCVYGDAMQKTYYSEEIGYGIYNTRIENYIKIRNNLLAQDYGVEIQAYRVNDVFETLLNDAMAGTVDYDAAMPFLSDAIALGQENLLYDLNDFAGTIHLEAPWWDQKANAVLSFDGKQYFAVGDVTFSHKKASAAVLFNKTLAYDLDVDFYSMVGQNKWTLDTMYETGKLLAADLDGIPGMGLTDTWGTVGTYNSSLYHYIASGKQLITIGVGGTPKATLGDATALTTLLKIQQTLLGKTDSVLPMESLEGEVADYTKAGKEIFESGRALFFVDTLASVASLRKGEKVEFGILPMPLQTASQKSYYTPVMGQYAYGICIPKNVSDAAFSAYMTEALACYSKNSVSPEYEEGLLRSTNYADWDSRAMLEIIFGNMVYDLGMIHGMGGAGEVITNLYRDGSTAVASAVYGILPDIEAAITEYQSLYRD